MGKRKAKQPEWDQLSLRDKLRYLSALPDEQKDLIGGELLSLYQLREQNPLAFFEPYPKQAEFLAHRERTKAFFGGNRAGKTEIGVVDNLVQCLDRQFVPEHLLQFKRWDPPFFCRIVFPKFGQGELAVMRKIRELCPPDALKGGSFDKALAKAPNYMLRFLNGSFIVFNTGDQDRDAHAGVDLHRVHFDEEPLGESGYGIFQESRNRLIDYAPHSQMMFTMTPQHGLSWTYDEVWDKKEDDGVFCIVASMLDNPYLPVEEVERRIGELSEEEVRMLVYGEFAAFHGRVIELEDKHLVDPPSRQRIRGLQATYVGIDPGWRKGGILWVGFDKDNVALVFDELYTERLEPEAIVPLIKQKNAMWGVNPLYVIDPAGSATGDLVAIYTRLGIYATRGKNDRLAGALQLKGRVKAKHPGLFVSRDCRHFLKETDRWVVAADEIAGELKVKVKGAGGSFATMGPDHLCDPLRYICMERLWFNADEEPKKPRPDSWDYMAPWVPPPPEHGPLGQFA